MPMWKTSTLIGKLLSIGNVSVKSGYQPSEFFTGQIIITLLDSKLDETGYQDKLFISGCNNPCYETEIGIPDSLEPELEIELSSIILSNNSDDRGGLNTNNPELARLYGEVYALLIEEGWTIYPHYDCVL